MDDLLSQLRDIRGLDRISWWPLAPGWWVLIGAALLLLITLFAIRAYKHHKDVQRRTRLKKLLADLRREQDRKKQAAALSELLRRMAIRQHGRQECAGLEGEEWLDWLTKHDPSSFDWSAKALVLIKAPYAPHANDLISADDMNILIGAAERWVR